LHLRTVVGIEALVLEQPIGVPAGTEGVVISIVWSTSKLGSGRPSVVRAEGALLVSAVQFGVPLRGRTAGVTAKMVVAESTIRFSKSSNDSAHVRLIGFVLRDR